MTECERLIQQGIFSPEFFKPEIRNDFLVDETRKKVWAIEIDLLREFDRVCKKHGLKYFLFWGSLIGAVRHKGFVPWDDDLDVCMTRNDYDKFLKLSDEFKAPYFLQTPYTDKNFFFSQARIRNSNTADIDRPFLFQGFNLGIFIDILPIDKVIPEKYPQDFNDIYKLIMANSTYMRLTNPYLSEQDKKRAAEYIENKAPLERYEEIQKIAGRYKNEDIEYIASIATPVYGSEHQIFNAKDFSWAIEWDFEGFKFPIPCGYDNILKTIYGDYMKFPPAEKRGTWHKNMIFNPDVPYKDLLKKYQSAPWPIHS